MSHPIPLHGRGTPLNPGNRFESAHLAPDPDPHPPHVDDLTGLPEERSPPPHPTPPRLPLF